MEDTQAVVCMYRRSGESTRRLVELTRRKQKQSRKNSKFTEYILHFFKFIRPRPSNLDKEYFRACGPL